MRKCVGGKVISVGLVDNCKIGGNPNAREGCRWQDHIAKSGLIIAEGRLTGLTENTRQWKVLKILERRPLAICYCVHINIAFIFSLSIPSALCLSLLPIVPLVLLSHCSYTTYYRTPKIKPANLLE